MSTRRFFFVVDHLAHTRHAVAIFWTHPLGLDPKASSIHSTYIPYNTEHGWRLPNYQLQRTDCVRGLLLASLWRRPTYRSLLIEGFLDSCFVLKNEGEAEGVLFLWGGSASDGGASRHLKDSKCAAAAEVDGFSSPPQTQITPCRKHVETGVEGFQEIFLGRPGLNVQPHSNRFYLVLGVSPIAICFMARSWQGTDLGRGEAAAADIL